MIGQTISHYHITEKLHLSGMGKVCRADGAQPGSLVSVSLAGAGIPGCGVTADCDARREASVFSSCGRAAAGRGITKHTQTAKMRQEDTEQCVVRMRRTGRKYSV